MSVKAWKNLNQNISFNNNKKSHYTSDYIECKNNFHSSNNKK